MMAPADGVYATTNRGKRPQSNRLATAAFSVPALRRQLSGSHEHRLRDARNERRSGPERFGIRQRQRNFFDWIFRASDSRRVAGGTVERAAIARANFDYVGASHGLDRH